MKLAASKVDAFVDAFPPKQMPALVLVYGPDQGGVRDIGQRICAAFLGAEPDPLQRADLNDTDVTGGRLGDEAAAIPMFGDKKLVLVRGGGGQVARAAGDYLAAPSQAALIVIETGALRPSAALRKLVEAHDAAMALPCFEADARQLAQLMRDQLKAEGFRIEAAALEAAVARLATDRGIMRREIERLALYKGPRGSAGFSSDTALITLDDVDAALGDQSTLTLDSLIDAVALGRVAAADQALMRLTAGGQTLQTALGAVRRHFQVLHLATGLIEAGTPQAQALSSFRPPLHFRRKPLVENQLRLWSRRKIERALSLLHKSEIDARAMRAAGTRLPEAVAGQILLRIARAAQR
jgi:DNA polymerase-3 subunit delta